MVWKRNDCDLKIGFYKFALPYSTLGFPYSVLGLPSYTAFGFVKYLMRLSLLISNNYFTNNLAIIKKTITFA